MAKKHNLTMTPIMSLAVMALFALMIPMFTLANRQNGSQVSQAADPVVATPSPSPELDEVGM